MSVVRVVDSSVIGASYYSIDCGGEGIREYVKDMSYIGGNTNCWSGCIDFTHESAIRDHAPQEVYLSERWGEYRYTLSGLEGGKRYKLRLHFIEPKFCGINERVFNVRVNGIIWLKDLDIYREARKLFRAIIKEGDFLADEEGKIEIRFERGAKDYPTCSGIEIRPISGMNKEDVTSIYVTPTNRIVRWGGVDTLRAVGYDIDGNEMNIGMGANTFTWWINNYGGVGKPRDSSDWVESSSYKNNSVVISSLFRGLLNMSNTRYNYNFFSAGIYDTNTKSAKVISQPLKVTYAVSQISCGNKDVCNFIKTTPQMCVQTYGSTNRRDVRVDTREEVSPGPEELYKTERWGEYSYTLSNSTLGLDENISFWYYDDTTKTSIPDYDNNFGTIRALQGYLIRFHFAETYFTRVGERVFDVYVNNRIAFKDLDIIHQTGGKNRALIKEYFAAADSMGKIVIDFKKGKADYPTCSGIEIIRWHSGRDGDYLLEVWPNMVRVNDTVQLNAKVYDGAGYMVPEERVEILRWEKASDNIEIDSTGKLIIYDIIKEPKIRIKFKIFNTILDSLKLNIQAFTQ